MEKERIKELKEERKSCNARIKELTRKRCVLQDEQRRNRCRTWRIKEILAGEIPDE